MYANSFSISLPNCFVRNGIPIFRKQGLFIPYQGRYDQALLVVPATKCEFVDEADANGSWSTVGYEFLRSLELPREVFYSTTNGTCYAGTFSCASQGEYSHQEFRELDTGVGHFLYNGVDMALTNYDITLRSRSRSSVRLRAGPLSTCATHSREV